MASPRTVRDGPRTRGPLIRDISVRGLLFASLVFWGCAVPVPPSGGPADSTPPTLVQSSPRTGETSFAGDRLILVFSEHIDRASFTQSVSLSPDPGGPLQYDWSGTEVRIDLPGPLRPETTYILTIDVSMQDVRNVSLDSPLSIAFATGDTINQGRIAGRAVAATDGTPVAGIDVFAYDQSDSTLFTGRPLYRTQSGVDGRFEFTHLRESSYFVAAVRDANGNRQLDSGELLGLPPDELIEAQPASADSPADDTTRIEDQQLNPDPGTWLVSRFDSIAPTLDEIRPLDAQHLQVRFSEAVNLVADPASRFSLSDSTGTQFDPAVLYPVFGDNRLLGIKTPPLKPGSYHLAGAIAAADSTGNRVSPGRWTFQVPADLDPPGPVVRTFLPDSLFTGEPDSTTVVIWPGDRAGIRFSSPISRTTAERAISVIDTTRRQIEAALVSTFGIEWYVDSLAAPLSPFLLSVDAEFTDSGSAESRAFVAADRSKTGEISGAVSDSGFVGNGAFVVELYRASPGRPGSSTYDNVPVKSVIAQDGSFRFDGLPGGLRFRIRAYLDANRNGTWNAGSAVPFERAEPVGWAEGQEPVRARWETALEHEIKLKGSSPW